MNEVSTKCFIYSADSLRRRLGILINDDDVVAKCAMALFPLLADFLLLCIAYLFDAQTPANFSTKVRLRLYHISTIIQVTTRLRTLALIIALT